MKFYILTGHDYKLYTIHGTISSTKDLKFVTKTGSFQYRSS